MINKPRPKVIIDVDNTLWNFEQAYYNIAKGLSTKVLRPIDYVEWDSIHVGLPHEVSHNIINSIHLVQYNFTPYLFVKELLSFLSYDFNIIIASHRERYTLGALIRWLSSHNLLYDDVYCGWDKTTLFDNNTAMVIDDSPKTLIKALAKGIPSYSLRKLYNKDIKGVYFFETVEEMYRYFVKSLYKNEFKN